MKSLNDLDTEARSYGGGQSQSNMFEFKKGANKIRILYFPVILATHFFGKGNPSTICVGIDEGCKFHGEGAPKDEKTGNPKSPSLKLITYVIDREDSRVKLAELPLSIRYSLQDLQNTEGFDFADFPMPYDVQVMSDPDNKDPKAKYRTTGIPKMVPLTPEEQSELDEVLKKITPEEYVEKRKAKVTGNVAGTVADPKRDVIDYLSEDINPEDIPF